MLQRQNLAPIETNGSIARGVKDRGRLFSAWSRIRTPNLPRELARAASTNYDLVLMKFLDFSRQIEQKMNVRRMEMSQAEG